jgi:hypothetical protein
VFSSFPEGVDPASGEPLFVTGVHPLSQGGDLDPDAEAVAASEEAMAEALAPLGDVTEPMPTDLDLPGETWESFYAPLTEADPDVWGAAADPNERGGVVVVRPGPNGGQGVVAVTSQVIDMSGLVREGDRLSGEVRVTVGAPVRLLVLHARSDGAAPTWDEDGIMDSHLTADAASEAGFGVVPIGKVPGDSIDVGDGPIVVRVEVGDAPGQVGLDGVGVGALASVGIPGVSGSTTGVGSEEPISTTVPETDTTGPAVTEETTPPGAVELEPMWWPSPDSGVEDDPVEVASVFVFEVLGEVPATVGRPGASSPSASSTVPDTETDAVIVHVPLVSGVDLPVLVSEADGRWAVVQVGDGGVRASTSGGATSVSGGPPGGSGDESQLWVALRREGDGWSVERGRLPDEPVSFEGADAAVIAVVDDLGQVIAANGNAL